MVGGYNNLWLHPYLKKDESMTKMLIASKLKRNSEGHGNATVSHDVPRNAATICFNAESLGRMAND